MQCSHLLHAMVCAMMHALCRHPHACAIAMMAVALPSLHRCSDASPFTSSSPSPRTDSQPHRAGPLSPHSPPPVLLPLQTYVADCVVWPPLQLINFTFVPLRLQVLYINACNLAWNTFLSMMASGH